MIRSRIVTLAIILAVSLATTRAAADRGVVLRVCADPNNLPFSNQAGQGFENRIAELIARELDARVEYTWWAQRRGFVRNTLRARECDVVIGVPTSFELALVTRPYYRSTYVFVSRADTPHDPASLDDERLRELRIGVQLVGDDYANTPPAHALSRRGIVENVRGYTVYGNYAEPNPPARILDALVNGEIDVAIVWGPLAGWYARSSKVPLRLRPVAPQIDLPFQPMVFDMSMGVRRDDAALRDRLEDIMERRRTDIDAILEEYGVPRVDRR